MNNTPPCIVKSVLVVRAYIVNDTVTARVKIAAYKTNIGSEFEEENDTF